MGAADDDVHRGRVGEHRQSPLDDFVPRRQLWQVKDLRLRPPRDFLSFGKLLLEARKIRSGKSLRNGIDRGLQIKASGELRGRAFDDPRAETVLIAANFERRRLQIPYQTS